MPTPLFKRLGIHKQRNQMITISLNIKKILWMARLQGSVKYNVFITEIKTKHWVGIFN